MKYPYRVIFVFWGACLLGCQTYTPVLDVSTQEDPFEQGLDQVGISSFGIQALTANYLERKIRHWITQNNGEAMRREIEFARLKHPEMLVLLLQDETLCVDVLSFEEVNNYRTYSSDFDVYTQQFACNQPATEYQNDLGMVFKTLPAGSFIRSSHQVTLSSAFQMQTTEVTQGQWWAVMGSWPGTSPSSTYGIGSNHPMYFVSWNDISVFINALQAQGYGHYRLPTEAEWEYAARAGAPTLYPCPEGSGLDGDTEDCLSSMAWYGPNADSVSHPVANKLPNTWGLYDLLGNVWEWVQDRYGNYPSGPLTDPTGPSSGSDRVRRGGSWNEVSIGVSNRASNTPSLRSNRIGFRLVYMP
jgi:hypothetical protein